MAVCLTRALQAFVMAVATSGCAAATAAQVSPDSSVPMVVSGQDTVGAAAATTLADEAPSFVLTPRNVRVEVSVQSRRLLVIAGEDTLRRAKVSVSSGHDFHYAGRTWRFATPRGRMVIRNKRTGPVWVPPDWHYAEVAHQHKLKLARLTALRVLGNGDRLLVRDSVVGIMRKGDKEFLPLPVGEHVIFDYTLFIPPTSTLNRRLHNELGDYALDLGDGYMLHGTSDQLTIGTDLTHGCIRLADGDLAWLYTYVPVGVAVVVR